MATLLDGLGWFVYPFAVCSVIATYIPIERWLALRRKAVMAESERSILGQLKHFIETQKPNADALSAYLHLQLTNMERGLSWLSAIVGIAPLLGLLGTVSGLVAVFGAIAQSGSDIDAGTFVSGIALALTTTMAGLLIAIPSLLAHALLTRKIDKYSAELHLLAQQHMRKV